MERLNRRYGVNVKIPMEYVKLIDDNLEPNSVLGQKGLKGRAEVVRHAVFRFLVENGIRPSLEPSELVSKREHR